MAVSHVRVPTPQALYGARPGEDINHRNTCQTVTRNEKSPESSIVWLRFIGTRGNGSVVRKDITYPSILSIFKNEIRIESLES